uniref:Ribosomal RNA-processing protein 44 n=1 Tax=Chromera velia CCMP2878 TaxID=1169474 RepID=A0A0G4G6P6_9ALVE|eukprot:Cvel_20546.t1-p1 / transcript=Cvel_20546.t1 / gene=Cvel_20546 / organism=Chromera_velia_CCMP2878 / gene_product=Exosome complex exonuclease RRP44, putative / transcript_product=Exosome complex exonuclease RRP44, putative / location=Cvel_scaffold1854:8435-20560(-) / protein_length=1085 / sequence_SO=supercontig / SO=protein_coding / is_pseudo=false
MQVDADTQNSRGAGGLGGSGRQLTCFTKKTKKGKIRKIVKEIYLRDDIGCRVMGCPICQEFDSLPAVLSPEDRIIVLDTNIALHNIDFLSEDPCIDNVVVPLTVLQEVRNRSLQTYARLRRLCKHVVEDDEVIDLDPVPSGRGPSSSSSSSSSVSTMPRRFAVFSNEFLRATFVSRETGETANDRNDRAIRQVAQWYAHHLQAHDEEMGGQEHGESEMTVLLLSDDRENRRRARAEGLSAMSSRQFVESMRSRFPNAGEKLGTSGFHEESDDEEETMDDAERAKRREAKAKAAKGEKEKGKEKKGFDTYRSHLSKEAIEEGLKSRNLGKGTIRMSRTSSLSAKVQIFGGFGVWKRSKDVALTVSVNGWENLNRAVDGDSVAVRVLEGEGGVRVGTSVEDPTATEVGNRILVGDEERDEGTVESVMEEGKHEKGKGAGKGEKGSTMQMDVDTEGVLAGEVVGIIRRNWREYCGTLRPLEEETTTGGSSLVLTDRMFIPANPSIPFIKIRTRQSAVLEGQRIVVVIDGWDKNSRNPHGHWTTIIGPVGDRDTESKVILREHGVITRDFSAAVLRCLPPASYEVPEEEAAKRLDMRGKVVCSVDPPGCKDIDDALSAEKLPNGNYRVGVHIADVSFFVKPDTAIDKEAAERCTTVYLVERRTDMLPGLLTTDLCSLVSSRDRQTFSVIWEMTPDAEEVSAHFTKAVIRSKAALTYEQAQNRIDDQSDQTDLTQGLRVLLMLAQKLRKQRMDKGALELASAEVKFELDSETADPKDVKNYQIRETNKMVEEFMLLANRSVAQKILSKFPLYSVLRRHPPPKADALEELQALLEKKGFNEFKFNTSKELALSLDGANSPSDPFFNRLVRLLTTRCMNQAVYFCTGEVDAQDYRHYGLAAELYTHFTSPIRRYADVLVHRLLAAAIGLEPVPEQLQKKTQVGEQCDLMNQRHRNAQFASRASTELHTYLFFKKKGPTETDSVVIRVRKNGLLVTVPRYGIEGAVLLDEDRFEFDEATGIQKDSKERETLAVFDHVTVLISPDDHNFRNRTVLTFVRKTPPEAIAGFQETESHRQAVEQEMFPNRNTDSAQT